jgi:serine/threonine protein kinase/tetratricopeptide (TPR) repeat protein
MALLNQRYRIIKHLGQGATATVYLASDALYGNTVVAMKIFRKQYLQLAEVNTLKRQFLTLCQIEHPNLARVFDFGRIFTSDTGEYLHDLYFTLEYVEGPSLLEATEKASWEQISELFYQLGHALSYLHAHGLIHGDLNPQNILVTETISDQEHISLAKIIDFGFVFTPEQSGSEDLRGTLPYLAPELINGQPFDHRIDLYALGVTLYEILTRRLPYEAEAIVRLLKDHLLTPPPPVSRFRPDAPPILAHLAERLLRKDAIARGTDALEIAHELAAMVPHERILLDLVGNFHVKKVVGREAEYNTLFDMLAPLRGSEQQKSQGPLVRVAALIGETGIGKTSLLERVWRSAQVEEIPFVYARSSALRESAIQLMHQTLRQLFSVLLVTTPGCGQLFNRFRSLFRAITPELTMDFTPEPASSGSNEESPPLNTFDAYIRFLQAAAGCRPFALCVEDVETLDVEGQMLLGRAVRALGSCPAVLLLSSESEAPLRSILQEAFKDAQIIPLGGLSEEGIRELTRLTLRCADIPAGTARHIREEIGGSPWILKEFLSQFDAATGEARLAALETALSGGGGSGELPKTVQQAYSNIFSQLKPEERYILSVASCFRDAVPRLILSHLCPYSPARLGHFLTRLLKKEILSSSGGGTGYRFTQARFHRSVFESIGETKQALHLLIAEELEKLVGDPEELAFHFHLAGEPERTYTYSLRAAERARLASAFGEQIRLLSEALNVTPDREKSSVLEQLAEGYAHTGQHQEASRIYQSLLKQPMLPLQQKRRYLIALSASQAEQGQMDEAEQTLLEAAGFAESPDDRKQIEEDLASLDVARGNYREARAHCLRVLEMSGSEQENPALTSVLNTLGVISFHENKYDDALRYFGKTLRLLEPSRRIDKLITAHINLGNVLSAQKRFEDARHHWQLALDLCQAVGSLEQEAQIYNNLGISHFAQQRYDEALKSYERSLALYSQTGNVPGQAYCQTNMAEVYFGEAAYEKALVAWERVHHLYEELQDALGLTETCNQLAHVHVVIGNLANSRACIDQAAYYIEQKGIESQRGAHYLVSGILLTREGEFESARKHLQRAVDFFQTTGNERQHWAALLRLAELVEAAGGKAAVDVLREVFAHAQERGYNDLAAHALFLLGTVAERGNQEVGEKPLTIYKRAFSLLKEQPVNEITWKLCFKLGTLYRRRGLSDRGREYLMLGASALNHLVTGFTREDLRSRYLETDGRGATVQEIRSLLGTATS